MTVYDRIRDASRVFVVAEIGSNHNGDLNTALRLMDAARSGGADAVKFQSFLADHLLSRDHPDHAMLRRLEMPREWYPRLKAEAASRGMVFFSTASNEVTLSWLGEIGVELYKIASSNLTHLPLLRTVAAAGTPIILSTGMASPGVIQEAVETLTESGNDRLCILHCVSRYPTRPEDVHLRFMQSLQELYPYPVGFSDHTPDLGIAVAAAALGARVIEKHLTLDRNMEGPDHHFALEPDRFADMVRQIRDVERALGNPWKPADPADSAAAARYWRSLHAARDLPAGTVLGRNDFVVIRPNDGLHSRHADDVIGLRLARGLKAGRPITWEAFRDERAL